MTVPDGVNTNLLRYGYIPTLWICALYVALFSLSTIVHIGQAARYKLWWLLPTVALGGIGEIIGWSGRLWSSQTYLGNAIDPFLVQICSLIISPTPIVAANFIILSIIINHLGTQYSRLSPKWYTIVFCSADVIALIVQAIGGAQASAAVQSGTGDPETGANIMLAGVLFQMASITIYVALATEFLYRYFTEKPVRSDFTATRAAFDHRIKLMILGLSLSTLFLLIRAIYRTVELIDGWTGQIIRTELYFNVLDAAMIVLALYTMNILHPGILLAHAMDIGAAVKGSQRTSGDDMALKPTDYPSRAWEKPRDESNAAVTIAQTV